MHYVPAGMVRAFIRQHVHNTEGARVAALAHPILKKTYRTYKIKAIASARKIDMKEFVDNVTRLSRLRPDEREALILSVEGQIAANPRDMMSVNRLVSRFLGERQRQQPISGGTGV